MKLVAVILCALVCQAVCDNHEPKLDKLQSTLEWVSQMILGTVAPDADRLIGQLNMKWNPFIGMYSPQYISELQVSLDQEKRPALSSVIRMMPPGFKTPWAKVDSADLLFVWQMGAPVRIHVIENTDTHKVMDFGNPLENPDFKMQYLVKNGSWAYAEVLSDTDYTLASGVATPGIEEKDITIGNNDELAAEFTNFAKMIHHQASKKVAGYTEEISEGYHGHPLTKLLKKAVHH